MDSSTTAQCKRLEGIVGGPEVLSQRTGSRAYEVRIEGGIWGGGGGYWGGYCVLFFSIWYVSSVSQVTR